MNVLVMLMSHSTRLAGNDIVFKRSCIITVEYIIHTAVPDV